jgi:acyl carrier protein
MNIGKEILVFFKSKGNFSEKSENDVTNYNYLEMGLIDSMELVEMIVLFEDKFKIKFSTENLQADEFRTIGGLIKIVNELGNEKKN